MSILFYNLFPCVSAISIDNTTAVCYNEINFFWRIIKW